MSKNDKLADELGQIIFRLETSMYTIERHVSEGPSRVAKVSVDLMKQDLEKLKVLKQRISDSEETKPQLQEGENHGS